jgi:hypothetical protein
MKGSHIILVREYIEFITANKVQSFFVCFKMTTGIEWNVLSPFPYKKQW